MLHQKDIEKKAADFLSHQLGIPAETIDSKRELRSMGMDSFRIIELVLFLERSTGLQFPDHAYTPENLKSVDSIVHSILKFQR